MAEFNSAFPRPKTKSLINAVWQDYLWFNKAEDFGYCTKCGNHFSPVKMAHKKERECPVCHAKLTAKHTKYAGEEIHWLVVPRFDGDRLLTRRYRICVHWNDVTNPDVWVDELFRDVQEGSRWSGYMWWHTSEDINAWMPYCERRGMFYGSYTGNYYMPHSETIYHPERLPKMLAQTKYRYFPVCELIEKGRPWQINSMIALAERRPWIELLYKVGFTNLVKSYMGNSYGAPSINEKATNVVDLLKLSHAQYKLMLEIGDPTPKQLKLLQDYPTQSLDDLNALAEMDDKMYDGAKQAYKLITAGKRKTLRYVLELPKQDARDYFDYVRWLDELGYPADDYYLHPADFRSAHDKLMHERQKEQGKRARREKRLQNKVIAALKEKNDIPAFHLHHNGLFVTMAGSADELQREGATLHHCVATYADRVAKGETTILFIRREEAPDTPYYTMEFKDGAIAQIRGKANCAPTGDVVRFRDAFISELAKNVRQVKEAA